MRLKDLIKKLQKIDEEYGDKDLYVCYENVDISMVSLEPSYHDGAQQIILRDEKGYPVSGKYKREGSKVQLYGTPFQDLLWDRDGFPIDYSELDEYKQKSYKEHHAIIVEKKKQMDYQLELEHFIECMIKRSKDIVDCDQGNLKQVAERFFNENLTAYDPIPEDLRDYTKYSYCKQRELQWQRQIDLSFDGYGFKIKFLPRQSN